MVDAASTVPDDPHEFTWLRRSPRVGCNNLRCSQCDSQVRQQPGCFLRDGKRSEEVWSTPDWSTLDFLDRRGFSQYRLYVCRCSHVNRQSDYALDTEDRGPGPGSTWSCQGHPQPSPVPDDSIAALAASFAHDLASWRVEDGGSPIDRANRLHGQFQTDPLAIRVGQAMATLLMHDEAFVRGGAIAFFHGRGVVPGYDSLISAAAGSRELFRDHVEASPCPAGPTLEHRLVLALTTLLPYTFPKRRQVLQILERDMLRPGWASPLLRPMLAHHGSWVRGEAAPIIAANPDAAGDLFGHLQWGKHFVDWVVELARGGGVDAQVVKDAVTKRVASPRREQIVSQLP